MSGAGAFWLTIGLCVVGFFVVAIIKGVSDANTMSTGTPQQKADLVERNANWAHGELRSQVVCPHCQERGQVRHKAVTNKKGISGGKATGAILTGGVSILATGLSRKEGATQAYCGHCQCTWQF
jgi:hypothetical protein